MMNLRESRGNSCRCCCRRRRDQGARWLHLCGASPKRSHHRQKNKMDLVRAPWMPLGLSLPMLLPATANWSGLGTFWDACFDSECRVLCPLSTRCRRIHGRGSCISCIHPFLRYIAPEQRKHINLLGWEVSGGAHLGCMAVITRCPQLDHFF